MATLTYDYQDSTAVLGPLATNAEPHTYDLCEDHAEALTVPRGWQVVRLQTRFDPAPPSSEDLLALVEAIREVAGTTDTDPPEPPAYGSAPSTRSGASVEDPAAKYAPLRRHRHLTVISGEGGDAD